jgi:hypothetical protein
MALGLEVYVTETQNIDIDKNEYIFKKNNENNSNNVVWVMVFSHNV